MGSGNIGISYPPQETPRRTSDFYFGYKQRKVPLGYKETKGKEQKIQPICFNFTEHIFCNPQVAAWVLEKRPRSYRIWFQFVPSGANQIVYCKKSRIWMPSIQITTVNLCQPAPARSTSCWIESSYSKCISATQSHTTKVVQSCPELAPNKSDIQIRKRVKPDTRVCQKLCLSLVIWGA